MNINLTLIAQMAWFGAFIWFTARFVWPYLMKAVEERQAKIAAGLAAAERGQQDLIKARGSADDLLAGAKHQSQDLVAAAQKRVAEMIEEAKATARIEGERQIAAARATIAQETGQAREQLRSQVAALAIAGAEQILMHEVDPARHREVLDQLGARL